MAFCLIFLPFLVLPLTWIRKLCDIWCGGVLLSARLICKIRFQVLGMENIPQSTVIFASKHQSSWDIFAFPFFLSNITAFVKKELMYIPLLGTFFKKFRVIPINRKKPNLSYVDDAKKVIDDGMSLLIFPEGTRVNVGSRKKYKSGVFYIYQKTGIDVVPVALNSGLCWPRRSFLKYQGIITVQFLPPIKSGMDKVSFMNLLEKSIEESTASLLNG
ncbi:lysophospholipid acyltransferase family protein [Candidatus Gromoviella agglomerans]|uniref:lysophospholipid acyltransferase family protein n=1 Tax=Candidatus Gromoviella agglomerans TaxID=2806609 RepID=UPI001E5A0210|nr:lysophospholipid acyltransferase family protein [Candidatus Gromoviella agglomerans]